MELLLVGALLLSQAGCTAKQFAMKKCGAIAPGPFNSVCINMLRAAICLCVSTIVWLIAGGGTTNALGHAVILIGGISTAINLFSWILASRVVSLLFVEGVTAIGSLVIPMLLTPLLYDNETISVYQWIGGALVFGALFLFSGGKGEKKEGSLKAKIAVLLGCAVGAAGASVSKKYYSVYIENAGLGNGEYFTFMSFVAVLAVMFLLFTVFYRMEQKAAIAKDGADARVVLPYKRVLPFILLAAGALYVNELFAVYAAALPAAIYYPLTRALTLIFTFFLDIIAFKDKITFKKILGLVVIIGAVVLINL